MGTNQNKLAFHFGSLSQIPMGFGFDLSEATEIIRCCYEKMPDPYKSDVIFQLTKYVVKECIYRISVSYFSETGVVIKEKPACLGYTSAYNPQNMPIPYRAVHILRKQGFKKSEIAEILNTSVVTVNQHLAMVTQYLSAA